MISTTLNELVHRFRSQGQDAQQTLVVNRSEFETLKQELNDMHCLRALRELTRPHPHYYGVALAIQENLAI